ncbi:MAG TPA: hypothetical protein VFQ85_19125 [Mycobacteriales bacterium]|jgi:hypothetical protein|nr:hypothetical protein [Mycobacteriales bacterium]
MPAKDGPRAAPPQRAHRVTPPPRTAVRVAPHALAALQRSAGNAAVSLAVQRLAGAPAAPKQDPRFAAVAAKVKQQGAKLRQHPPATAEAKKAQDAAVAPPDDREAKAKAARADDMANARPGGFDKAAFVAAVKRAVAEKAPKNLDEADSFATSGKAGEVKAQVAGRVTEGKQASAKDIAERAGRPPDTGAVPEKPVTPLAPERPVGPSPIDAAKAMPARAPPAATDLSAPKAETDQKMAEAGVTEDQLARSNEPEFTGALAAKKEGEQFSATAPAQVRAAEAATLATAQAGAKAETGTGLAAMAGSRKTNLGKVATGKTGTKARDEQKRAEFATHVKGIFDATKRDVDVILNGLDAEVGRRFDAGEKAARDAFTADHKARMQRYKDDRYDGWTGAARWTADLFTGLPEEANQIYVLSKQLYESRMERVISDVADFIGAELTRAKARIAAGQAEIKKFVASQPKDLQKIAQDAANEFKDRFAQLESDVDDKQNALVDDLASRYVEARNAVDEEIKAAQEANKGLWDKVKDAVVGAIETILKLKDMLLGVLARAAGAVEKIIKDPIGFLGNLVNAVGAGISGFASRIGEHLKKGLQAWLFGALAEAGIEIPETFDLKGIVKLILSILGLTWANIRARIVKALPGAEKVIGLLEKSVEFIQVILSEGVGGLWKWIVAKLSDLQEMVLGKIKEFVITKIVTAGITWLISMLNPAAAFVKACKMIYDVVMFFVEKAAQIKEFVDAVLDSVESIASGGVGAVAGLIENTLAKMVPVLIGFLASLLNLGGISEKIKSILKAVQKPVMNVVDKLIAAAVKVGKRLLAKLKAKVQGGDDSPAGKQQRLDKGVAAAVSAVNRLAGGPVGRAALVPILGGIKVRYGLVALEPVLHEGRWHVHGEVNPRKRSKTKAVPPTKGSQIPQDPIAELVQHLGPMMTSLSKALAYNSKETHAFVTFPGSPHLHYKSTSGMHAEQNFIVDVNNNLTKYIDGQKYKPGSTVPATMRINRTPCDHCARDLALTFGPNGKVAGRRVDLTILTTAFYGRKEAQDNENVVVIPASTPRVLADMRAQGVKMGPWDIWSVIEAQAADPRLAELKNETAGNLAVHSRLQGMLDEVARLMAEPRWEPVRSRR